MVTTSPCSDAARSVMRPAAAAFLLLLLLLTPPALARDNPSPSETNVSPAAAAAAAAAVAAQQLSDATAALRHRTTITNPDFDCGRPYPPRTRKARQAPVQDKLTDTTSEQKPEGVGLLSFASCGVTPIHHRFLLTASYCVIDPANSNNSVYTVRLGDLDLAVAGEKNSLPADYDIEEIYLLNKEKSNGHYNDIALLKTSRKIEFNEAVFPLCVSASTPALGTRVIAAGYGYYNETYKTTHLLEGELGVISLGECEDAYLRREKQRVMEAYPDLLRGKRGLICAGDPETGVCEGDEGGPLFREEPDGRRFLEGITSFTGSVCALPVLPGVFTAVADYVEFIDNIINWEEGLLQENPLLDIPVFKPRPKN